MSELGEFLRSARQKRNLSLDDVAQATRIKVPYLEALENGDYSLLPGPAYVTGFLRNYARFLGVHPDDMVEEYHSRRPAPAPTVKAATRVLASGYERQNRTRLLWTLAAVAALLVGGYIIKQYSDSSAHAYSSQLPLTPANLGGTAIIPVVRHALPTIHVRLRAAAPVWVHVTVDGAKRYEGILRPRSGPRIFLGHHAIYVITYDGAHLRAVYDGRPLGFLSHQPGLTVQEATSSGWQHVS